MLPKIDLPMYETTLPSTKEKIKYRTMTVKEEKILLVAQEAGETEQVLVATKQVLNNCLIDVNVESLAMFDMEYMLLLIRSKSVDNVIKFQITDPDTQKQVDLELDIEDVKFVDHPDHSNEVKINEDYSLFLKYPTIDEFIKIANMDPTDPLVNYFIMVSCLDSVASEDEVSDFNKYTDKEVDQFMEDLNTSVIQGIQKFFDTMPKLRHELEYVNENGDNKTFIIEGLNSFFS